MPTSIMEAIMHDVPTVSYKIPGVDDIIINKFNGIKLKIKSISPVVNEIQKIYNSKLYKNFSLQFRQAKN